MGIAIIVPDISFEDANLGKVTIIGEVPYEVNLLAFDQIHINIESNGDWWKSDTVSSVFLPVKAGQEYELTQGSNDPGLYALLASDDTTGSKPQYADGHVGRTSYSNTIKVTIDGNTKFLWLRSDSAKPSKVKRVK